ncbi:MAG: hypothetical protein NTW87_09345 [Planctomycetota bacterium]|nr:hypothetical protein [Planctomycetota bacterium]
MPYLLAAFVVLVLIAILQGCNGKGKPSPDAPDDKKPAPATKDAKSPDRKPAEPKASRAAADDKAAQQRQTPPRADPPPKKRAPMACCYEMAAPPTTFEYVCPTCGGKTLYALSADASEAQRSSVREITLTLHVELETCRRTVAAIPGSRVELDDSQFCRNCSPGVVNPQLVLVVRRPGSAEPHRFAGVTTEDVQLVREYLAGSAKHVGEHGYETPLMQHAQRIEQLLGAKVDGATAK